MKKIFYVSVHSHGSVAKYPYEACLEYGGGKRECVLSPSKKEALKRALWPIYYEFGIEDFSGYQGKKSKRKKKRSKR